MANISVLIISFVQSIVFVYIMYWSLVFLFLSSISVHHIIIIFWHDLVITSRFISLFRQWSRLGYLTISVCWPCCFRFVFCGELLSIFLLASPRRTTGDVVVSRYEDHKDYEIFVFEERSWALIQKSLAKLAVQDYCCLVFQPYTLAIFV